jgi:hypothetical protein
MGKKLGHDMNLRNLDLRLDVNVRVVRHTHDTVVCVEILVKGDLEHARRALPVFRSASYPEMTQSKGTNRDEMTDQARKNTQMRYQRSPYASMTLSLLLTQFLYHR